MCEMNQLDAQILATDDKSYVYHFVFVEQPSIFLTFQLMNVI
jgi:hypothetical protein